MTLEQAQRIALIKHFAQEKQKINTIKDAAIRMISELKHIAEMNDKIGKLGEEEQAIYNILQMFNPQSIYIVNSSAGGDDA